MNDGLVVAIRGWTIRIVLAAAVGGGLFAVTFADTVPSQATSRRSGWTQVPSDHARPLSAPSNAVPNDNRASAGRLLAKDGTDLPPQQATTRPGIVVVHPGEAYDFEVMARAPSRSR